MAHRLQTLFATADGEANYVGALRALIEDGQLHAAETVLMADIAALDTTLAQICADTPRETVILNGWPELVEAIASYEGDPVTGVTIGMGNEPDLAFEKDRLHAPFVTLGLYCDGDFAFSSASRAELLAECQAETPRWAGAEEDVEVYLEIDGLADINTRLIHHKHRFFLRDGHLGRQHGARQALSRSAAGRAVRTLRHAQLVRLMPHQDGRHPAMLRDIDNLLLADPAHDAKPVLRRRKAHHGIERLAEHAPIGTDDRKLGDGQAGDRLYYPRGVGAVCANHGFIDDPIPFRLLRRRPDRDPPVVRRDL